MNIIINQHRRKDYWIELHDEYLKRKGKFKFFLSRIVGIIFLMLGILNYLISPNIYVYFFFLPYGIFLIVEFYVSRKKFTSKWSENDKNDRTIILENDSITLKSHSTERIRKWDYYIEIVETEKGIFLIPEEDTDSIYIQKSSFGSKSELSQIIEMMNRK